MVSDLNTNSIDWVALVEETKLLYEKLFPICRSITGNGVRETLKILQNVVDFKIHEIPTGTTCYDWTIPDEWNIRDAYIKDSQGKKIIDFKENNLHVLNYSAPIDTIVSYNDLKDHLHTLPNLPNAIPYRTSYYEKNWGFCMAYDQFKNLNKDEKYQVKIDSDLKQGSLTYGDGLIQGSEEKEFLISTYCCHPSMGNDNLSGVILWALLFRELKSMNTRFSYRFVIAPETIGAIAYLAQNEKIMRTISGGFVITCVAGPGKFGFKKTFLKNHKIDRIVKKTFQDFQCDYIEYDFDVNGSDETHFSAPFFRIPICTISKDKYYEYEYYHTSLDDLDFVSSENLIETIKLYFASIENLELDKTYKSLNPYCEAMLSKRNLYPTIGGKIKQSAASTTSDHFEQDYEITKNYKILGTDLDCIGWLMFYCDGDHSLLDIAEKTNFKIKELSKNAKILCDHNLLEEISK